MSETIFILEDDSDLAALFAREIERAGMTARPFRAIKAVRAALATGRPDLCVLDLGLPDGDGLDFLRDDLAARGVPVVVVSGRGSLDDRVEGLSLGADDYLAKPADPAELVARIRSVLRRMARAAPVPPPAETDAAPRRARFAGHCFDADRLELTGPDGDTQRLSRADADLLTLFLHTRGRVVSRDWLVEQLFEDAGGQFDRSVDVRVSRLRKKLGDPPRSPKLIRTVYGAGYVFAAGVEWD
ncbi:response regulator transcription factor [Limimaricola pyoseonensis]|uniref:DNA-binding response regulator, OmpR family, contains REC and winged-helix (WHTH) domain n=1 Tax=Limimaricola pyoseonensis TaxID=521013 RepID=A0A1G7DGN3_9RHOB|nr:response regulator transcription factor [Limimaricola pyoseonensis]SDE49975.1 DNA-binding response regulator, OmpR family, contains REC and winged-helix (wHTH) domain [Limimaricola pyoseonensis]